MANKKYKITVTLTVPGTLGDTYDMDVICTARDAKEAKEKSKAKMMKMIMAKKNWKAKVEETAPLGYPLY